MLITNNSTIENPSNNSNFQQNNFIEFKSVTKKFDNFVALNNISINIEKNKIHGLIGASGAGKSTLIRLINGLEKPTKGIIKVDGHIINELKKKDLRKLQTQVSMIFQSFNLFSSKTVLNNVIYPLKIAKKNKNESIKRANELLDFVGLSSKVHKYPSELSGGQKQRVAIARALANSPKIILSDEATASLDPETTNIVLELLKKINKEFGVTIIAVTHEMDVVRKICSSVSIMKKGEIVESGDSYNIFENPKKNITRKFISSALNDLPIKKTLEHLRKKYSGYFVTVPIIDNYHGLPFSKYLSNYNLEGSMIYGGIVEIGEKSLGSMTYNVIGDDSKIKSMLNALLKDTKIIDYGYDIEGKTIEKGGKI